MSPADIRRPTYRAHRLLAQAAVVLCLAACGPSEDTEAEAEPPSQSQAAAPQQQATAPDAAAPEAVLLSGEGLQLAANGDQPARTIAFEAPMAETVAALTRSLGAAPERSSNEECGSGAMELAQWGDRMTAFFQEGRLVGWRSDGAMRTAEGLRVGSTRGELNRLPGVSVEKSTLGAEFTAGELGGLLESDAPDAKVTDLWAGDVCAFR
jgi:hypothetical protein